MEVAVCYVVVFVSKCTEPVRGDAGDARVRRQLVDGRSRPGRLLLRVSRLQSAQSQQRGDSSPAQDGRRAGTVCRPRRRSALRRQLNSCHYKGPLAARGEENLATK